MNDEYPDITTKYTTIPRVNLVTLKNDGHQLFIGDLIRDPTGRVVIAEMGEPGANLFTVFAATDELFIADEFASRKEAECFINEAQGKGWEATKVRDFFAGIKWLIELRPRSSFYEFPWLRDQFPGWLPALE